MARVLGVLDTTAGSSNVRTSRYPLGLTRRNESRDSSVKSSIPGLRANEAFQADIRLVEGKQNVQRMPYRVMRACSPIPDFYMGARAVQNFFYE